MKTMRSLFLVLLAALLVLPAGAQISSEQSRESNAALANMRRIELLHYLLPLLLTKSQLNELLPAIERARDKVKQVQTLENKDLKMYQDEITAALKRGVEHGEMPAATLRGKIRGLLNAFEIRRQIATGENFDLVNEVIQRTWNAGQKKAAAGTLDPALFNLQSAEGKEIDDEAKLQLFVREVLLDDAAYGVLVELAKHAKN